MSDTQALPSWSLALQAAEYRALLPALAYLPDAWAYAVSAQRGRFNARHDRDWVSLSLRHRHIWNATLEGFGQFLSRSSVEDAAIGRFMTASREEAEVRALALRGLEHFDVEAQMALAGLAKRPKNRGLVLITAHVETFVLGIAALASRGERIHPMMSKVSEDPRIHPAIRDHFQIKYAGLQRHLNGGLLADAETSMRHFYKVLSQGEIVVVLADAPAPTTEAGVAIHWMGHACRLAQGALRLATHTGSALGAFACHWRHGRRHEVVLSEVWDDLSSPQETYQRAFSFLEHHIRMAPERWWGVHLLPACIGSSPEVNP